MPFEFEIDPVTGVCYETWTGSLTVDQVEDSIRARHADPRFHATTPRVIDLSHAEGQPSRQDVRKLALMHRSSPYKGACALVAPEDHQFDSGELFESIVRGTRPIGLFRTRDDASEWLTEHLPGRPAEEGSV